MGKMSIEVDWQIIKGEGDKIEIIAAPSPPRPRMAVAEATPSTRPEPDSFLRSAAEILDVQKDQQVILLGSSWDWSPDGKWLAVTQNPSGVMLVQPDLSVIRWIETPNCPNVAWRPFS
jgi:hypothetical protein